MTQWIHVNDETCYKIYVFDDGNQRYEKYTNIWFIVGSWGKGKVRLLNIDNITKIRSISRWKLVECE